MTERTAQVRTFCSVAVNMKLWISCIFLNFRVANKSKFTLFKKQEPSPAQKKIKKPAAALVKAKICQFSSTFLKSSPFKNRSSEFPAPS
jgi:hypothetical protein